MGKINATMISSKHSYASLSIFPHLLFFYYKGPACFLTRFFEGRSWSECVPHLPLIDHAVLS